MTMLDRMRRHKGWLKWSLFFVVVAFILLYIPSYLQTPGMPAGANAVVATVEGRDITANRFRRALLTARCRRTGTSSAATWTRAC